MLKLQDAMIDHERRVIFIHIPKTAGVSIYDAFGSRSQMGHLRLNDHPSPLSSYFTFTIVRNPWDRAVSTYAYLRSGGRGNKFDLAAQEVVKDCSTFNRFAQNIVEYRDRLAELPAPGWGIPHPPDGGDPSDRRYPHLLPQTVWTHDHNGEQILDFVGRFERLDADFAHVARVVDSPLTLGHVNTSNRDSDYRGYFTRQGRQAIADAYGEDIETFGYVF